MSSSRTKKEEIYKQRERENKRKKSSKQNKFAFLFYSSSLGFATDCSFSFPAHFSVHKFFIHDLQRMTLDLNTRINHLPFDMIVKYLEIETEKISSSQWILFSFISTIFYYCAPLPSPSDLLCDLSFRLQEFKLWKWKLNPLKLLSMLLCSLRWDVNSLLNWETQQQLAVASINIESETQTSRE